ncbi:MAG: exodeoxyribonuclease VII large subunit [Lentisphaeria bacterium]|nr:exodeoxyribonuclease VII large subunit [Lentisphaeria bacterium]
MPDEQVWSISEINAALRDMIENSFMPFWIRGEISNLVLHRSGHAYCSLKDDKSQMRAAFFGGAAKMRELGLQNGALIEAFGNVTVYEVRGEYQFSMRKVRPAGMGELQLRFEELRRRLEAEGLFDPMRKRELPFLPRKIGLVTSPTGAAVRDFLQILERRFPRMQVRIVPVPVQGAGSAPKIAGAVDFLNRLGDCDVIVVTRGGGSMEDLWEFNEEVVARAVAASRIPVVSAVGHEIDFTICDFAADLRAPTPSAAAEMVAPREEDLLDRLAGCARHLRSAVELRIASAARRVEALAGAPLFREPGHLLEMRAQQLDEMQVRMTNRVERNLADAGHLLNALALRLDGVDPRRQLERGYAILTNGRDGKPITSAEGVVSGTAVKALLADGELALHVD